MYREPNNTHYNKSALFWDQKRLRKILEKKNQKQYLHFTEESKLQCFWKMELFVKFKLRVGYLHILRF